MHHERGIQRRVGMNRTRALQASVLTCCLLLAGYALGGAPSTQEKAAADALFRDAKQLMAQGRFADACPKLEESQRMDPQGGTLLSLAMCHESIGKVATAWIEYQEARAQASRAGRADRVAKASSRIDALEKAVPTITVRVDDGAASIGLQVTRDGLSVGTPSWGVAVPVDLGEHLIAASAPGFRQWSKTVRVELGERIEVQIPALERMAPAASASTPAPAPKDSLHSQQGEARRTWGWALSGVGVAALGVGTYFGLRALSKDNSSESHCHGSTCDASGLDMNSDALRSANVANVAFGVGIIGLGLGSWLLLTSSQGKPAPPARGGLRGVGVSYGGRDATSPYGVVAVGAW